MSCGISDMECPNPDIECEECEHFVASDDDGNDYCYECSGLGDDYSFDDAGELVNNCTDCPFNPSRNDDD